ncbi:MAG: hypothetical protein DRP87_07445 [Spirochaetes bacterium]|nr:MAG: hypothetical protein DRP87_07445 [Spirochaetota bacterium]
MRLRVLSAEDTHRIHRAALRILREVGMHVMDEDTRKTLLKAGCTESEPGNILFPEKLVERTISTIPYRFILFDRNGKICIDTADEEPNFGPGLNCIYVLDHRTGEHREYLLEDVREAVKVCEKLQNLDMASGLGNPVDVSPDRQALETVKALVDGTSKPFPFIAHDEREDEKIWEYLAGVAGSWNKLADKPFALDLTGPYSPLELGVEACRRLKFASRRGLPVVCYPAFLPGATGPVTLDGAIAQSSAEILAGLVVHQLECPGSPVITGSSVIPMDLQTGMIAYGSPEYVLAGMGAADYFSDLGVPTWIGAGCSDSHIPDAQAASEAGMNIFAASMCRTSFIHNLGFLSGGKTGSLEMLVLCDEIAGALKRIKRGIAVSEETIGVDVVKRAVKERSFIVDLHTLTHMREAMRASPLFKRISIENWKEEGAKSTRNKIKEILASLISS